MRPLRNVSWSDAKQYVAWLAETTRKPYRLPTEAEWEYAARGRHADEILVGRSVSARHGQLQELQLTYAATEQPIKVGSFKPNPFGLYDMGGGVDQWVEDCWHKNYQGAPADGSAWVERRLRLARHPIRFLEERLAVCPAVKTATATIRTCDIRPTDSASHYRPESVEE